MTSAAEAVRSDPLHGSIDTAVIRLDWLEAPWDTAVFGYPVVQVSHVEARTGASATDLVPFVAACDAAGVGLASCRLPHDRLRESMLLEEVGFRFIEMVFQPEFGDLQSAAPHDDQGLVVERARPEDLAEIVDVAGGAFGSERFHVDPRLPSRLGDLRYQNWVRSSLEHPTQRLHALRDGRELVAFFVTEQLPDGTCYWHLNAVAPNRQGRGYGLRAWRAMMNQARLEGATRVRTSIVARNHRVLNLYARLGFSFPAPSMTFHRVRAA